MRRGLMVGAIAISALTACAPTCTALAAWGSWSQLPHNGAGLNGNYQIMPSLNRVGPSSGLVTVFAAASNDGRVYRITESRNGQWDEWVGWSSGGGIDVVRPDALVPPWASRRFGLGRNQDGRLELFALSEDRSKIPAIVTGLWHSWQLGDGSWSNWTKFYTPADPSTITNLVVGSNDDGRLEVFVRGDAGEIYQTWQTAPNNGWSGIWNNMGKPGCIPGTPLDEPEKYRNQMAWVKGADGLQRIFAANYNCPPGILVRHIFVASQYEKSGGWSDWSDAMPTSVNTTFDFLSILPNQDGRLELFYSDFHSLSVIHTWQDDAGRWTRQWDDLGAPPIPPFSTKSSFLKTSTVRRGDGRLAVFMLTENGLYERSQTAPNSGWGGWAHIIAGPWNDKIPFNRDTRMEVLLNQSGRVEIYCLHHGSLYRLQEH